MGDGTSRVWIDVTLIPEQDVSEAAIGVPIEFYPADDENIGERSIPVIYKNVEATIADGIDVELEFFHTDTTINGLLNVAEEYYVFQPPRTSGVKDIPHEFTAQGLNYNVIKNVPHIYSTGYNPVSGTLNKSVVFTAGRQMPWVYDTLVAYAMGASVSGGLDYVVNYSNFSGNTNVSGEPIPFYTQEWDIPHEFIRGDDEYRYGSVDRIIDVSFAGWIMHHVGFDAYSTLHGYRDGYNYEVTISGGGVDVNYLEVASTALTVSGVDLDIYCALTEYSYNPFEAETIKGRIVNNFFEVSSTAEIREYLTTDIDLYSLKITNFSLDIGEYTTASDFISVDVLDDTCQVSTSGTYFMVDGVRVPVTFSGIQDGYRMYYDPEDDFGSLEGPTIFTAHVENGCGQSLEHDYYLTFGYIAEYNNYSSSWQGIDYWFNNKVAVRVTAENWASCPQTSSLAWDFESREKFNRDLGASIVGRLYDSETNDISAEIRPQSLTYFYGKEFEVVLVAKDLAGNEMEPLILRYRIEDKPEN